MSGGDVMPDRSVEAYANANGADAVLAGIKPVLEKGDAAWFNLEGVTSTLGTPKTEKTYTFEGPPAFAPAIAAAGVDVVTMGNNHSVDYGRAALRDTIARLEKAGVQVVGAGSRSRRRARAGDREDALRRHHRLPRLQRRVVARLRGHLRPRRRRPGVHRRGPHEA